jgi:hypothetical protein
MKAPLSRWAKTRLEEPEYAALAARAGLAGLAVSAYIRSLVVEQRAQFDAMAAVHALEDRLRRDMGASSVDVEPLLVEAVLLAREVLAQREPQALARVRAQLDARYPGRKPL